MSLKKAFPRTKSCLRELNQWSKDDPFASLFIITLGPFILVASVFLDIIFIWKDLETTPR